MKKTAVLLTVHNRREKTLRCLKKIFCQRGLGIIFSADIYMTNDGCVDGTIESVAESYPQVVIIPGDGSLFWNRGMYVAWKKAAEVDYDYYLWLNDDTFLAEDAIDRLIAASALLNDKSVVLGTTCDSLDSNILTYGGRDKKNHIIYDDSLIKPCLYMNGNIALIPKPVFLSVGFNDPYYSHSTGDTDYGLMAIEHGFGLNVAPGLFGICRLHDTISDWCNPAIPLKTRWRHMKSPLGANPFEFFYFNKKHFGIGRACFIFVTNFIHLLFPKLWNNKPR